MESKDGQTSSLLRAACDTYHSTADTGDGCDYDGIHVDLDDDDEDELMNLVQRMVRKAEENGLSRRGLERLEKCSWGIGKFSGLN